MLQNLLDKYISFVNKKPLNNIFKCLMFGWVFFLSFLYSYNYRIVHIWIYSIITFLIIYFFIYNVKKIQFIIKNFINFEILEKKFSIKIKYVFFILPIFAFLVANLSLLIATKYVFLKITPFNDFLWGELNIIQKIFSSYLFYLLMTFLVYALGRKILKIAGLKFDSGLEKFIFSVGIGFVPFMFTTYFIALAGWLYSWVIWLIVAIFFIFALSEAKKIIAELKKTELEISFNNSWRIYKNLIILILLIIFTLLIVNSFKPIATDGDDLHTYYNAPYLYVSYHQFKPLKHFEGANTGQNTEMVYAGIMSILGSRYIMHFSLYSFLLIALGVYSMLKKIFNDRFAILGLLTVSLIPWNWYLLTTIKTDFFLSFYLILIIYLFYLWQKNNFQSKYLYLIGVLAGISIGIKYNAFLIIIPLYFAIVITIYLNKKQLSKYLKPMLISVVLVIIFFSPWGIKNQIYFNNVLYPFEFIQKNTSKLNGFYSDPLSSSARDREILYWRFYYDRLSITNFFKIIFYKSTRPIENPSFNNFGFIPLLMAPFYFLLLKDKKILYFIFILIFSIALWYLTAGGRTWYMYSTIILLSAALPYLFLQSKELILFFLIFTFLSFSTVININKHNSKYLIGDYDDNAYKSVSSYYNLINYINDLKLKSDEKILTFSSLFIEKNDQSTIKDDILIKSGYSLKKGDTFYKEVLKNASIKYIYLPKYQNPCYIARSMISNIKEISSEEYQQKFQETPPLICKDIANLIKFLDNNAKLIYDNGDHAFYKIQGI